MSKPLPTLQLAINSQGAAASHNGSEVIVGLGEKQLRMDPSIVRALCATYDANTLAADRSAAYEILEKYKLENGNIAKVAAYAATALGVGSNVEFEYTLRYYCLLVMESYMNRNWNSMEMEARVEFRNYILEIVTTQGDALPSFVLEKIASLLAQVMKRTFPQHWKDCFEHFGVLCGKHPVQGQVVFLVLKTVVEDCSNADFNTMLPSKRRNEILQGLHVCAPSFLVEICQYVQGKPTVVVETVLSMLTEFGRWLPLKLLVSEEANIGMLACLYVDSSFPMSLQYAGLELLNVLFGRSFDTEWRRTLGEISMTLLSKLDGVKVGAYIQRENAPQQSIDEPVDEEVLTLHGKIVDVLVKWGNYQAEHVPQDQMVVRNAYLEYLMTWITHPSLTLLKAQLLLWVVIVKKRLFIVESQAPAVLDLLWNCICTRNLKIGSPDESNDRVCAYSQIEFDDEEDFIFFFGSLRGAMLELGTQLVLFDAPSGVQRIGQFVEHRMQNQIENIAKVNVMDEKMHLYIELEGLVSLLEGFFKKLPIQVIENDASVSNALRYILNLFEQYVTLVKDKPIYFAKVVQLLCACGKFYQVDANLLSITLQCGFECCVYPKNVPAAESDHKVFHDVRFSACRSLIHLCKAIPQVIVSCFSELCQQVLQVLSSDKLQVSEQVLLYEALIVTSNALSDENERRAFLELILQNPIASFTKPELTSLLEMDVSTSIIPFLHGVLGKYHFDVSSSLSFIYCILRRLNKKELIGMAWSYFLPNVFRLMDKLNSCWQHRQELVQQNSGNLCWLVSIRVQELMFFSGKNDVTFSDEFVAEYTKQSEWPKWAHLARERCCQIISIALQEDSCYKMIPFAEQIGRSVHRHLEVMEHRHVKQYLHETFIPFTKKCPPSQFQTLLHPMASELLLHGIQRLNLSWQMHHGNVTSDAELKRNSLWYPIAIGVEANQLDTIQNSVLIDVSIGYLDFMAAMLNPKTVIQTTPTATASSKPKHVILEKDVVRRNFVLFSIMENGLLCDVPHHLGNLCLILLASVLKWKNSYLLSRTLLMFDELIKVVCQISYIDNPIYQSYISFLGHDVFGLLLEIVLDEEFEYEKNVIHDSIALVALIYMRLTLRIASADDCKLQSRSADDQLAYNTRNNIVGIVSPKEIIVRFTSATPQQLLELDAKFYACGSTKQRKQMFKEFLEGLKQTSASNSNIANLIEPLQLPSKKSENIGDSVLSGIQLFQF